MISPTYTRFDYSSPIVGGRYYWSVKFAIMLAVLAFVVYAPRGMPLVAFIVLGGGHFSLTHYYQARAGKISIPWVLLYASMFFLLVYFFVGHGRPRFSVLSLMAATIFMLHFFFDEAKLASVRLDWWRMMEIVPAAMLIMGYFIERFFRLDIQVPLIYGAAGLCATRVVLAITRRRPLDMLSIYLLIFAAVLIAIHSWGGDPRVEQILGFIILVHYLDWYVHFIRRTWPTAGQRHHFLTAMIVANVVFVTAYAVMVSPEFKPARLGTHFFFSVDYFYIWTILHILFTVRPSDYGALVPGKA